MSNYIITLVLTTVALTGWTLFVHTGTAIPLGDINVRIYEWFTVGLILSGALFATITASRLTAVAALGMAGFGVALVFVLGPIGFVVGLGGTVFLVSLYENAGEPRVAARRSAYAVIGALASSVIQAVMLASVTVAFAVSVL
jgi:hypothetical protein